MKTRSRIGKTVAAVVLGAVIGFASLTGGIAYADDGDVDGRDFLIWQRSGPIAQTISGGDLADWQSNYGTGGSASTGSLDPEYRYVPVRR